MRSRDENSCGNAKRSVKPGGIQDACRTGTASNSASCWLHRPTSVRLNFSTLADYVQE
jgi:hypothetical protein